MSEIIWLIKYVIVSYHLPISFNKTRKIFLQVEELCYYFQVPGIWFRWTLIKINSLSFLITSIDWKDGDWIFPPSFPLLFPIMKNVILLMKGKMNGKVLTPVFDSIKSLMKVETSLLIKFNWFVFNKMLLFCSIIAVLIIFFLRHQAYWMLSILTALKKWLIKKAVWPFYSRLNSTRVNRNSSLMRFTCINLRSKSIWLILLATEGRNCTYLDH